MLERATLEVLARAAEIGLPEFATVPVGAYDPFFRPILKKRVVRAVDAATKRTTRTTKDGEHILRLAFLAMHPSAPPIPDPNDERIVREAYESLAAPFLPPKPPQKHADKGGAYRGGAAEREPGDITAPPRPKRKFWPITTSLVALIVAGALGSAAFFIVPFFIPTPYEKFQASPAGKALGDSLTDYIANTPHGDPDKRNAARNAIKNSTVEKQLGKDTAASFATVLDAQMTSSSSDAAAVDEAIAPLAKAVNDFDQRVADQHLPVHLHSYASGQRGHRNVWVTSYFVENREILSIGEEKFKVAWVRRLDSLNLTDSALYKGTQEEWALVSLPHMDEELVEVVLTPLSFNKPMGPEEYTEKDQGPRAMLARTASQQVTTELRKVANITPDDAKGLENAISHRNDALVGLAKSGVSINATPRIWLSPALVHRLEATKEKGGWEAKLAGEALRMNERIKAHAKPLLPVVNEIATIEEEQFFVRIAEEMRLSAEQKKLQEEHAKKLAANPPVFMVDGDAVTTVGVDEAPQLEGIQKLTSFASSNRGRAIAAGVLALLARDSRTSPHLALWLVIRRALSTELSYADTGPAALALGELYGQLGLGIWKKRYIDDDFATSSEKAMTMPPEKIKAAAAKAYEEIFKRPVPPLTRTVMR
jgi:hypothetical protein